MNFGLGLNNARSTKNNFQIHAELTDNGKVLIHCVAGVSRSATLCLAYLTKYKCRSLREAYHLMASKRPMVRPVVGFWKQLISFEQVKYERFFSWINDYADTHTLFGSM